VRLGSARLGWRHSRHWRRVLYDLADQRGRVLRAVPFFGVEAMHAGLEFFPVLPTPPDFDEEPRGASDRL